MLKKLLFGFILCLPPLISSIMLEVQQVERKFNLWPIPITFLLLVWMTIHLRKKSDSKSFFLVPTLVFWISASFFLVLHILISVIMRWDSESAVAVQDAAMKLGNNLPRVISKVIIYFISSIPAWITASLIAILMASDKRRAEIMENKNRL